MNLNSVFFEDLLAEGVPVHVAARTVEERKAGGPFKDWRDLLSRLVYTQGAQPGLRPADEALLRHVKGCFLPATSSSASTSEDATLERATGGALASGLNARKGHWWEWPDQNERPPGDDMQDDTFPTGT